MKMLKRIAKLMTVLIMLGMALYGGLIAYVCHLEANPPEPAGYDAIIVLGAQVKENGEPSIQLSYRLDTALETYRLMDTLVVTCGAQGADEPMPEGDFMRQWLIERGVSPEVVYAENESFNTRQNIENAMQILAEHDVKKVLIITSDYHLPRAMAIARDAGVDATGVGSPCKNDIINWGRNHGREALAWVKYWAEKYIGLSLS